MEDLSSHEMGTATCSVEEASSTERAVVTCKSERDVMKTGGRDGGARLTVAEGVVLCKVSVGENTNKCRENDGEKGGRVSCLPKRGRWEER